jgi:hypothetical protein
MVSLSFWGAWCIVSSFYFRIFETLSRILT